MTQEAKTPTIWITSDSHFRHENIIKYEMRPFVDRDSMDDSLITRWNSVVKPLDIVYHLGDFGLGHPDQLKAIRAKLNGRIILIRGNHDDSLSKLLQLGFDGIADELTLQYKQWHFVMTHIPKDDLLYDSLDHGLINLHGHIHGKKRACFNRINVSCDAWDYTPQTLDDLLMEYRKQRRN